MYYEIFFLVNIAKDCGCKINLHGDMAVVASIKDVMGLTSYNRYKMSYY
jgi:hypothetical protein